MDVRTLTVLVCSAGLLAGCADYQTIEVDGRTREYLVHEPDGSAPSDGWPVVLAYHGAFTTARSMQRYSELDPVANDEGFLAVYPNGIGRVWNDGRTDSDVDDVAFTDALIDRLDDDYGIDPSRVFATGMSNGGFMSQRLGCELGDRIAAIAPVAGTLSEELREDCSPARALPVLLIMGTEDNVVPYAGGELGGQFSGDRGTMLSAEESIDWWVQNASCDGDPTEEKIDTDDDDATVIRTKRWEACADEVTVALYSVDGGGHTWPGADPQILLGATSKDIHASEEVWSFFSQFSLPTP